MAFDVLIAGGGPAGAAAAVACAQGGLSVMLAEREPSPVDKPGEALHPGVDSLLTQLGVEGLDAVTGARFEGVEIVWDGQRRFDAFGHDDAGPWQGRQVRRRDFDALLLERAASLGVEVRRGLSLEAPLLNGGRVIGATSASGDIPARIIIDASGPARWLERRMGLAAADRSPSLVAFYGYVRGDCLARSAAPGIEADESGWTWIARVAPDVFQWVRLDFDNRRRSDDWRPDLLADLEPITRPRGAGVSWRVSEASAGPGWFLVGDAAAMLDPTSSHGVLKGLMSGVMAGRTATAILRHDAPEIPGLIAYRDWLEGWFDADARVLASAYADLGATGFG